MDIDAILAKLSTIDTAAVDALNALVAAKDTELTLLRQQAHGPKKVDPSPELAELRRSVDELRAERDGLLQKLEAAPTLDAIDVQVQARLKSVATVAQKTGCAIDSLVDAKDNREMYIRGLTHLGAKFSADESEDYLRCLVDTFAQAPNKSAADALATQPQAAVDPRKAANDRIKAAQAAELADIRAAQVTQGSK